MNCVMCGAYIERKPRSRQKYCPACRSKRAAERDRLSRQRRRERELAAARAKQKARTGLSVEEVVQMAGRAGMSYGQYVMSHGL